MGTTRQPATPAIGKVAFAGTEGTVIPASSLVATQSGIQYTTDAEIIIDATGTAIADITAVQGGTAGNVPANAITVIPVSISGVTSVTNPEPTYGGQNEETDEALRERYFEEIKTKL